MTFRRSSDQLDTLRKIISCVDPKIRLKDFNNKRLVKSYVDFKDKGFYNGNGFEVLSIALDTNKDDS